jgi:hypothetical protein
MPNDPKQRNEGEGNRTAAREYNRDTREFIESGQVESAAEKAKQALQGAEGDKLRKAETEGRSRAKAHDSGMPPKQQGD